MQSNASANIDVNDEVQTLARKYLTSRHFSTKDISIEASIAIFGKPNPSNKAELELNQQIVKAYKINDIHSSDKQSFPFDIDSILDSFNAYQNHTAINTNPVDFETYISTIYREFLEEIH